MTVGGQVQQFQGWYRLTVAIQPPTYNNDAKSRNGTSRVMWEIEMKALLGGFV